VRQPCRHLFDLTEAEGSLPEFQEDLIPVRHGLLSQYIAQREFI
jgi:hypothetical protein